MHEGTSVVASRVLASLDEGKFYSVSHQRILGGIRSVVMVGMPPTPQLLAEDLKREGYLENIGGTAYLVDIAVGIPSGMNLSHYIESIRETASLREIARAADHIASVAADGLEPSKDVLSQASDAFFRLGLQGQLENRSPAQSYSEVGVKVLELFGEWESGNVVAVSTQIPELDDKLKNGGFAAGDLVVIAARTSFGKSALALQIALSAARAGVKVIIFSLEMSDVSLFIRNLATVSEIPHYKISPKTFLFNRGLADIIRAAVPRVAGVPIRVDHTTRKLPRLLNVAREWRRGLTKGQRALMITDYMQLVDNKLERRTRNDEVAGISIELKGLARELDLPIIGVSQLTRSSAKDNRRPEVSDLRESGQLEQDADVILFPWSKDGIKDERIRHMSLYCPKQRGGQVGWEIPIDFDGDRQWFYTDRMYAQERGEIAPTIDFNDEGEQ